MNNCIYFVKMKIQISRNYPAVQVRMDGKKFDDHGSEDMNKICWPLKGYESRNQVKKLQPAVKVSVTFF